MHPFTITFLHKENPNQFVKACCLEGSRSETADLGFLRVLLHVVYEKQEELMGLHLRPRLSESLLFSYASKSETKIIMKHFNSHICDKMWLDVFILIQITG